MCKEINKISDKVISNNTFIDSTWVNQMNDLFNEIKNINHRLIDKLNKIKDRRKEYEKSWKYYYDIFIEFLTSNTFLSLEKEDYIMLLVIWICSYTLVYLYRSLS